MLRIHLSIIALACLSLPSLAKENSDDPGLKLDTKATDFELLNQSGEKVKLTSLTEKGTVAVVFHRSAGW